jgi:hypothetical protein
MHMHKQIIAIGYMTAALLFSSNRRRLTFRQATPYSPAVPAPMPSTTTVWSVIQPTRC